MKNFFPLAFILVSLLLGPKTTNNSPLNYSEKSGITATTVKSFKKLHPHTQHIAKVPKHRAAPTKPKTTISTQIQPSSSDAITSSLIISDTNNDRTQNGFAPLSQNNTLTSVAKARLENMINNNYFAHVSPSGEDVVTESASNEYNYLYLGENLASGDFSGANDVVNAWMNSPGHRANILNKNYTEIGVAVWYGDYLGRKQWLAVQIFGHPLTS